MASVRCGERSELSPPRSEQKLSSGVLERDADADSSVATDAGTNDCADALRLLLTQANPRCPDYIGSRRMDDSGVEHVAPALDVAFPVMHAYNLQLTDTIAVQLGEVDGAKQESRDLLRPSVRLLCSIGRSLVAEQYRRQMPERIRLRGVKAPKMSEEARREEREYLHQTLPPTGVAVANLRWRAKDLGGVTPEAGACTTAPDGLKSVSEVEEKVVARSVASTVPQLSTALTNAGWLGARKSPQPVSIMSAAKLSGRVTSCAAHSTKSLTNGVASYLKCHETPCSKGESSSTVVGAAPSDSLKSLGTAKSAARLKGTRIRPCNKKSCASLGSGNARSWRRQSPPVSALLPSVLRMAASSVKWTGEGQTVAGLSMAQGNPRAACVSRETEACKPAVFASSSCSFSSACKVKGVHLEGGSGDVVASDAMMCPMCSFSSCDKQPIFTKQAIGSCDGNEHRPPLNLANLSCHNIDTAQVKRVLLRKKKDIILHLYSVIQLTTKSVDRRKVLKASALQKIFKKSSMEVDIEHIINSEAYVLGSLQDGLHCFDLLTSVEFFTCLNDRFATKVNLENVVDVLYVISANLSKLRSEIHLVFRKNIQPHICLRILTASAIVCAALKSSQLALAYSRTYSDVGIIIGWMSEREARKYS
ncbi:hypothetical protein EGR_10378 [Echinococcus granulosus]|uniref:Uncharacterized protein n=1 Tax=Echinococcus granulosus TaxID=6210 RepID=W6UMP5_ECHGR|nr:hypothetical protein EGR_10378 [Echinococcus granulosus]EUB54759.1 hypothetical protein EGR_10378 [Echinococcus granulosus]